MRNTARFLATAFLLGSTAVSGYAQTSGAAPAKIGIEDARRIAMDNGMTNIREIEFDDGRWEVEGRNAQGRELEVKIDAQMGTVVKLEQD